jgi:transposase InsO family protein
VRFRFVEAEKAHYPIRLMCRCLRVSRSGYYAWRKRPSSARAKQDARLRVEIAVSHTASRRTYGSPRILRDLREEGHRVSRKRVARLMRELGLEGRRKRRFRATTDSKHRFPVAPNVLMRDFDVETPNTAWVTDITYVATLEGWLYLAVVLDLYSRRVVGYAMSERIDRALVLEALREALMQRPGVRDLIHHSDRGSQYASHDYREALEQAGITCSMSRRGNCWDNAVVESFFGTLKTELLYELPLQTRGATRSAVADYIDAFYNVRRRHSSLDYQSPVEFELKKGGVLGGSAPEPPFMNEGRRGQEGPGLAWTWGRPRTTGDSINHPSMTRRNRSSPGEQPSSRPRGAHS